MSVMSTRRRSSESWCFLLCPGCAELPPSTCFQFNIDSMSCCARVCVRALYVYLACAPVCACVRCMCTSRVRQYVRACVVCVPRVCASMWVRALYVYLACAPVCGCVRCMCTSRVRQYVRACVVCVPRVCASMWVRALYVYLACAPVCACVRCMCTSRVRQYVRERMHVWQ